MQNAITALPLRQRLDFLLTAIERLEVAERAECLARLHREFQANGDIWRLHRDPALTKTQNKVFDCLAQGMRQKEIVALTGLSPRQVEYEVKLVKSKLRVNNDAELVRRWDRDHSGLSLVKQSAS